MTWVRIQNVLSLLLVPYFDRPTGNQWVVCSVSCQPPVLCTTSPGYSFQLVRSVSLLQLVKSALLGERNHDQPVDRQRAGHCSSSHVLIWHLLYIIVCYCLSLFLPTNVNVNPQEDWVVTLKMIDSVCNCYMENSIEETERLEIKWNVSQVV